ncbi:F-box/LRR-repeat protein At4g14103-like [Corylus avellana]|uniref:F-box/LRR-repeat protein At4g14103-like n=1 Tax=Corylus avellana TaxID=13451 RepID=UPI00286CFA73|nr:F-box/LRR-repeat protein At4g14103-like [Corylus avellana]
MEANSLIQKSQKKQKLNEQQDIDGNSKCLGNLPEEILRHILSFLPTQDAFMTSVLSKRWEYLWASIPNLDFDILHSWHPNKRRNRTLFMNFVDRVFCLRDSSDIKRFTFCCDVLSAASRVNTWVISAVRHNVQELHIELQNCKGEFSLPYCLFTCKTLRSLDLDVRCILKLPTTVCFSNLKILTIGKVTFSNDYLTHQFFSGLPVLEKLKLNGCYWGGLKVLRISGPKLHFLRIGEFERENLSFRDGCQVMIFGVSLKEFNYCGSLLSKYCLYESLSLEKADIHIGYVNTSAQIAHRMYKLLTGLCNVEFLRLSPNVVKVLIHATQLLPHMPMFNNLVDLKFSASTYGFHFGGTSVDLDCEALLKILRRFPCLENLEFLGGLTLSSNCEEDDRILEPAPPCFSSHLKWIKVYYYDGDKKKLSAIKILLKKAVVLEKIVLISSLYPRKNLDNQVKVVCKQLMELPRGSQNCKIVLDWYDPSAKRREIVL